MDLHIFKRPRRWLCERSGHQIAVWFPKPVEVTTAGGFGEPPGTVYMATARCRCGMFLEGSHT